MKRAQLLAALLAGELAAQTVYKSTLPDGRVVYGDKPDPAAAKVEETTPDTSKHGIGGGAPREAQALKDLEKARLGREGEEAKLQTLQKTLLDAEAAQAAGKEPLPGERIGTAGGASRLDDSYWARQRALEQAVEKARRELEAARAAK
jgi:hypothetical protein